MKKPELPVSMPDIQALIAYYAMTRRVGHTKEASQGLSLGTLYLVLDASHAQQLARQTKADVLPLGNLTRSLKGRHCPLVLDNAVILQLCATVCRLDRYSDDLKEALEKAEDQIERLTSEKNRLQAQYVEVSNDLRGSKAEIEQLKSALEERSMNTDVDSVVYFIKRNGIEAAGSVKYGSGKYHSDEFDFATDSSSKAESIQQLCKWMVSMEAEGYKFLSVEEMIDSL